MKVLKFLFLSNLLLTIVLIFYPFSPGTKSRHLRENQLHNNALNADLFLSIHNNWFPDKDIRGTMTLYYTYYKNTSGSSFDSFQTVCGHNE